MPTVLNKQTLLLSSLQQFYKKQKYMEQLVAYVDHPGISLRLLDFLCTKYAKQKKISYVHPKTNTRINLYTSYKDQLKAYSKLRFDPFRRHERILFQNGDQCIETTIAQLNFFKWIIEMDLVPWIEKHLPQIEKAMKLEAVQKREHRTKRGIKK